MTNAWLLPPGSRLASARVLRRLYERPTASVYLCEDRVTTELLVVKHARPRESSDAGYGSARRVVVDLHGDAPPMELFMAEDTIEQECKVAHQLQDGGGHPNVVRYLDICAPSPATSEHKLPTAQEHFLVMEYCANGDLFTMLERQDDSRFDETTALYFFHQIVQGLQHLHQMGIAHRDISLENVLLDAQWQAKLCDFALSTSTDQDCRECVGKLHYMAPEVLDGLSYDPVKADMWSLGILLFIMMTGSPLFHISAPSDPAWSALQRVGITGILTKWGLREQFSPVVIDLLTGMLRISPSQRIQSLEEILDRLPALPTGSVHISQAVEGQVS
ncbi:hypothetical protein Poli38472_011774 [Pythium oligandrum]|uniref:Protein kinase domain-containing protein n=1 Tax=Pythium oligandrum TaxID=41045 RepID=A0A8K1FDC8_PYTOL|nr:hypothetical protein Poli38472_011774 [Pythium oligandrum]|eukprot:TMW58186.1 hypothetical protein Poli38472_011774 [Pythium oligandrum]